MNEKIIVVTKNCNGEIARNEMTIHELITAWLVGVDNIPTDDDKVVGCILGNVVLYFDTFGHLMEVLSGAKDLSIENVL